MEEEEIKFICQENIKFELICDSNTPHVEIDPWPDIIKIEFLFIERYLSELIDTLGIFVKPETSKWWVDSPHPPRKLHNFTFIS